MLHRFNRECCTFFFPVWHSDFFLLLFFGWLSTVFCYFCGFIKPPSLPLSLSVDALCCCCEEFCVCFLLNPVLFRGGDWRLCVQYQQTMSQSGSTRLLLHERPQSSARTDTPTLVCLSDSHPGFLWASYWSSTYSSSCVQWF